MDINKLLFLENILTTIMTTVIHNPLSVCLRLTKVIQSTVRVVKKYINESQIITYITIQCERVAVVIVTNLHQGKHVLVM
jgi:hypothetical protein